MAIYLDYEGIKGNVTAEGYEGMIALKYFKFNVSRKISMEPGAGQSLYVQTALKPTVQAYSFNHNATFQWSK